MAWGSSGMPGPKEEWDPRDCIGQPTERLPNGNYMIVWHARGNEYSLHFTPAGDGFALDGLGEGPP